MYASHILTVRVPELHLSYERTQPQLRLSIPLPCYTCFANLSIRFAFVEEYHVDIQTVDFVTIRTWMRRANS